MRAPLDGDDSILEQERVESAGCRGLNNCSEVVLGPLREGGENDGFRHRGCRSVYRFDQGMRSCLFISGKNTHRWLIGT